MRKFEQLSYEELEALLSWAGRDTVYFEEDQEKQYLDDRIKKEIQEELELRG